MVNLELVFLIMQVEIVFNGWLGAVIASFLIQNVILHMDLLRQSSKLIYQLEQTVNRL